jgi:hypothetical protein
MDARLLEDAVDQDQLAGDAPHAARRQGARPGPEHRVGVAVGEAPGEVGVAAADDGEVARQHAVVPRPSRQHPGLEDEVRTEPEGGGGDQQRR